MIFYIVSFVFGLVLGSFYNVVGLRVPNKESILKPPSHCPRCKNRLRSVDLLPVLSYFFLRGRCRFCHTKISFFYPFIEFTTAALFAVTPLIVGFSEELLLGWAFISLLVIIFVTDSHYMLIPDSILAVFAAIFLLFRYFQLPFTDWWQPLLGAAVGFMVPFLVAVASRGNMGGGDIKLFAVLGVALGWQGVLLAFFFSTFFGALIGGAGLATGMVKKGQPVPFGVFVVPGALTAYFYGGVLLNWYLHL